MVPRATLVFGLYILYFPSQPTTSIMVIAVYMQSNHVTSLYKELMSTVSQEQFEDSSYLSK